MVTQKNIRKKYIEQGKAEIIERAAELFSEKSIEKVTMEELAEKSGVGVATLYRYFGTKKRIAIEVGISQWNALKNDVMPMFSSEEYLSSDGITRIKILLDMYSELYENKRGFLLFLDDFDGFCLNSKIDKEELKEYQSAIADFYAPYSEAVKRGKEDGTIRLNVDERILYLTVNHTMISLLKKMARGEILAQDDEYNAELAMIKEMLLSYFKI